MVRLDDDAGRPARRSVESDSEEAEPHGRRFTWRAAVFVDRILRGAKPADLPVEQPTRFDLVVNLRTAEALDIDLPDELMLEVTEGIG